MNDSSRSTLQADHIIGASILFSYQQLPYSKRMIPSSSIIVWNNDRQLFIIMEPYFVSGLCSVYRLNGINHNASDDSIRYNVNFNFRYEYLGHCDRLLLKNILLRIEDIYGMSIDEFSLGKLDYDI